MIVEQGFPDLRIDLGHTSVDLLEMPRARHRDLRPQEGTEIVIATHDCHLSNRVLARLTLVATSTPRLTDDFGHLKTSPP